MARATALKKKKEKPLDGFSPNSYAAILEGTLLTNGDLKAWRARTDSPHSHATENVFLLNNLSIRRTQAPSGYILTFRCGAVGTAQNTSIRRTQSSSGYISA